MYELNYFLLLEFIENQEERDGLLLDINYLP